MLDPMSRWRSYWLVAVTLFFPTGFCHAGVSGKASSLCDAQGGQISTAGYRSVDLEFEDVNGKVVVMRDKSHVSDRVQQPLLSYGKLLRRGWQIVTGEDNAPKLYHAVKQVAVPIHFKNDSLMLLGRIRRVECVRAVHVRIPKKWNNASTVWQVTSQGFPLRSSSGNKFVDLTESYNMEEWRYRTTFGVREADVFLPEFCEDLNKMSNRAEPVDGSYNRLIAVLTQDILTPEQMGFIMSEYDGQGSGQASSSAAAPMEVESPSAPVGGADRHSTYRQDVPQADAEVQVAELSELPVSIGAELVVKHDCIGVAGVSVTANSSIAVLRAACKYLEISQGGSKGKLWDRLSKKVDEKRLLASKNKFLQKVIDSPICRYQLRDQQTPRR